MRSHYPVFATRVLFTLVMQSVITLVIHSNLIAQVDRKGADKDPLSTVIYLLSQTEQDSEDEEKACLAKSLASVGRFSETHDVIRMVEKLSYVDEHFAAIAEQLILRGQEKEASDLMTLLLKRSDGGGAYLLKPMIRPLIRLERDREIASLIERLDDSEKIDLSFEASSAYVQLGNKQVALEILNRVVPLVENSEYPEDKADLAFHFAELGSEAEALRYLRSALGSIKWSRGEPEYSDGSVIQRCIEVLERLGKTAEARELQILAGRKVEEVAPEEETDRVIKEAWRATTVGDKKRALVLAAQGLKQLDPTNYGDSFALGNIVEIYLALGETKKADSIARGIAGSEYMRQRQLLNVAHTYAKSRNKRKALSLLEFALKQVNLIDISNDEDGRLWTSNKWEQAQYQSQIALRLMDMHFDRDAVQVVSRIKKPYLRALMLTEYVSVNQKRIPVEKLSPHLDEALVLLRQEQTDVFDSKRYDVFAITARTFAEIGMPDRANQVFTETLTKLDAWVAKNGMESSLIYAMCNIGADFNRSNIKASVELKTSLRTIIRNWEAGKY